MIGRDAMSQLFSRPNCSVGVSSGVRCRLPDCSSGSKVNTCGVAPARERDRPAGAVDGWSRCASGADSITTWWVPGALEVPQVARAVAASGRFHANVALGAVVRGDTYHHEVVSDASAAGLMRLSLDFDVVITNGILTVDGEAQALVRSGGDDGNEGAQAALAALQSLAMIGSIASAAIGTRQ